MISTTENLREQAARCRRLARSISPGDVADALNDLAEEYEQMARVAEEPRSFAEPGDRHPLAGLRRAAGGR